MGNPESEIIPIRLKTIEGLPGLAAADQHVLDAEVLAVAAALVHAARHQTGGADEISIAGLAGVAAADQHVIDAEVLAVAHQTRHIPGGADALRWTVDKILKGAGAGADATEIDVPAGGKFIQLLLSVFQATAATGTATTPQNLNDNNVANPMEANLNEYGEVDLGTLHRFKQWRDYGDTSNIGDGVWKIQYLDENNAWQDWVTGIACRATATWTNWSVETEVVGYKIRLIATTEDSVGYSSISELEVKY